MPQPKKKRFPDDYRDQELLDLAEHYRIYIPRAGLTREQLIQEIVQAVKTKRSSSSHQKKSDHLSNSHRKKSDHPLKSSTRQEKSDHHLFASSDNQTKASLPTDHSNPKPKRTSIPIVPPTPIEQTFGPIRHIQASTDDSPRVSPLDSLLTPIFPSISFLQ